MNRWAAMMATACLAAAPLARAQEPEQHARERHGNPADIEGYIALLLDPARDQWQKPDQLVTALRVRPGQVVCDIGAGPGYLTLRLATAVGKGGLVYAVDVEPRILAALRDRLDVQRVRNVVPVLAVASDPLLPPRACDLMLIVNTYHHFPDGPAYLRRLGRSLRPGGRIANVDYHKRETPVGPPLGHRIAREEFLRQAQAAGLTLAREHRFLPYQYALELRVGK